MLGKRPEGQWVMAEFDRYAKMADQLRKNYASGPLDDKEVRELLRRFGLKSPGPRPQPGAPAPPPAEPFPVRVYAGGYRWPLDAGIVSSEFGQRRGTPHQGMDLAAELRVPVYAAAEGEAALPQHLDLVQEPEGGAHRDHDLAAANLGTALRQNLQRILETPIEDLLQRRYKKFRALGRFAEEKPAVS
jgi:hypothetical protein